MCIIETLNNETAFCPSLMGELQGLQMTLRIWQLEQSDTCLVPASFSNIECIYGGGRREGQMTARRSRTSCITALLDGFTGQVGPE